MFVAPSLAPTLERDHAGRAPTGLDRRDIWIATLAMILAVAAMAVASVTPPTIGIMTEKLARRGVESPEEIMVAVATAELQGG